MQYVDINRMQTISGAQQQFNSAFPFLKIEFFREPPVSGRGNAKNKMIVTDMKLENIQSKSKTGKIVLHNDTTVGQLEEFFQKEFGLYVQVFRKSGRIWLETTATDNWTLSRQNEEGRSLEEHLKTDIESPDDHDIY
jgi:hypothetical protein